MTTETHLHRREILGLSAVALLSACSDTARRSISPAPTTPLRSRVPADADKLVDAFVLATGIADLSIAVLRGEKILYLHHRGNFTDDTQIPIASSSKWMAGATIMALVDKGLLRLDAHIAQYVPGLSADYGALRLDQLLSYTAGLPGLMNFVEFKQPADISLTESAQRASREPLASQPGTQFDYGGANLQFVGAAAEQVTKRPWQAIFDTELAQPLGMRATWWGGSFERPDRAAPPTNPMLQGGAWTTLSDYAAFLTMIAQNGIYRGRRVLSLSALGAMGRVMTIGLRKGFTAPGAQNSNAEYMIAHWCERVEAERCSFESSPGLFGTYPWIDRRSGLHGIIFLKDRLRRIAEDQRTLRNGLIQIYA